jgi:hypothetical protein
MKKYTIEVGGRGAECYVFPLTDEQLTKLKIGPEKKHKRHLNNT